jgi:hypothetical protein
MGTTPADSEEADVFDSLTITDRSYRGYHYTEDIDLSRHSPLTLILAT